MFEMRGQVSVDFRLAGCADADNGEFQLLDKKRQSKKGGILDMLRNKYTLIKLVIGC